MLRPDPQPSKDSSQLPGNVESASPESLLDPKEGMRVARRYTKPGFHPYDEIEWEQRDAVITNEKGEVAFEQRNIEVPKFWSQLATNVVAQKYFRGHLGTPGREQSVRQLVSARYRV